MNIDVYSSVTDYLHFSEKMYIEHLKFKNKTP